MASDTTRTLKPFSNLKNSLSTIYDHLPYKKDISLVRDTDVRLVSGNVVKNRSLVSEEPVIINTNPLANDRIEQYINEQKHNSSRYVVEEYNDSILAPNPSDLLLQDTEHSIEPVNSFAGIDEDDDDYSFLLD